MNYQECMSYLYSRLPMFQRQGATAYKKDLTNTLALLNNLKQPQQKFKAIHIAGTNGKGSSAHTLAAIFQSAGYCTGLYTSPHLKSFTERIRINGIEVSEQFVMDFVQKMKPTIETIQPSFFEVTVAMAFSYFAEQAVDIAIIETGLGGRLDSTNVIIPEVSLITSISFDHMDLLGDTLEKIAGEKAGIIKNHIPVVIGADQPDIAHVFLHKAQSTQSELFQAHEYFSVDGTESDIQISHLETPFLRVNPQIKAAYYRKNLPGVLSVIQLMQNRGWQITLDHIKDGIEKMVDLTGLKGRFQVLENEPLIIADISHNEDGLRELFRQIRQIRYGELHIIYGTVRDKSLDQIMVQLPSDAKYYFTQAQIPRSLDVASLQQLAATYGLVGETFDNVNHALDHVRQRAKTNDLILITGSTFVVAEIAQL